VAAYEGNVSARLHTDRILITPSRKNKALITSEDLVEIDLAGRKRLGPGKPSSESRLHVAVYAEREDVGAVVHAHPPCATAFAVAGKEMCIDCMPETLAELRAIPLVPYGTPGTAELPERLREHLASAEAFLLRQHGVLTLGGDLDSAYFRLEMVEHAADILYRAEALGGPQNLDAQARAKLEKVLGRSCGLPKEER
jgi:L-fuculose-phosphate aldolase